MPLNSRLSVVKHAQMLAEIGTRVLVFSPHLAPHASDLAEQLDGLQPGVDALAGARRFTDGAGRHGAAAPKFVTVSSH